MLQNVYMWHDIFASQQQSPHKSKKICVKPLNLVSCIVPVKKLFIKERFDKNS